MSDVIAPQNAPTPILGLNKPAVDGDIDIWGDLTNANWDILDNALLKSGGSLTGSIAISRPMPALINNAGVVCGQVVAGSFTYNAYLDTGGAWHYRAANTALYFGSVGGMTGIAAAVAGAADAVVTWGPASVFDAHGNFGIALTPPAGAAPAGASGGWMFSWGATFQNWGSNVYYGADSNWHYEFAGVGLLTQQVPSGWLWMSAPSGAVGAVATMATLLRLDLSGNLTAAASVFAPTLHATTNAISDGGVYAAFATAANYCLFGDATNLHLQFENGYRWQYTRATGMLSWVGNNAIVASIDYTGLLTARAFMSTSGTFYVAANQAYYLGRSASDGNWRFVQNNATMFQIDTASNATAWGNITAVGGLYARNGQSVFAAGGSGVILQFAPSWYFDWNATSGQLTFYGSSALFFCDSTGSFTATNFLSCRGGGSWWGNGADGVVLVFSTNWYLDWNASNGTLAWVGYPNNLWYCDGGGNGVFMGACYATAYPGPSDARLKKNVQPWIARGLAEIINLQPVSYQFNGDGGLLDDGITRYGIVAQDAQAVMPEAVHVMPPMSAPKHAVTGEEPDTVAITDRLAFDSGTLVFAMVNAIKEITARLVALENAAGTS